MSYISFLEIGQKWISKTGQVDVIANFHIQQKYKPNNPVAYVYQKIIMQSGIKITSSKLLKKYVLLKDLQNGQQ